MPAVTLPDSLSFGVLKQKHPDYDADTWQEILDLYAGGYQLQKRAGMYLPRLAGENELRYQDRLKCAAYIGYLGQIADYFKSSLFSQDLVVTEAPDAKNPNTPGGKSDTKFYSAFAHNADLAGNPFAAVMRDAFLNAMLLKRALICVDFPKKDAAAKIVSRADEDAIGANRAYVYEMPLCQLINWELDTQLDKDGNKRSSYEFAVVYTCDTRQASPAAKRGSSIKHRFKVWTRESDGVGAHWWLYEKLEQPEVEKFTDDMAIPLVDDGATSFDVIPIIPIDVKSGLCLGEKLGLLAKEHWARRSCLVNAENASLLAIPYIKRGPEMSAIGDAVPSQTQQNPHRGSNPVARFQGMGWVEIGQQDELGFAEPAGGCYELTGKELKELKDEMHRIVHQMAASVDNSSGMMRRSGDSKKQDRGAEAIVLGQYGKDVRDGSKTVYDVVATARKETVVWVVRGLDKFETAERADFVAEAVQLPMIRAAIPSKTFGVEETNRVAMGLASNLPPETQDTILKELQDGIESEDELRGLMQDAKTDQAKNDPQGAIGAKSAQPPPPPGKGVANGKQGPPQKAA